MATLAQAIEKALRAHAGQKEKNGGPCIPHTFRGMLGCDMKEKHEDFIMRVSFDPTARTVKLRDVEGNFNILRIDVPSDKDLERLKRSPYSAGFKKT